MQDVQIHCFNCISHFLFFFFNDTATTEIYTLSLHDALPISRLRRPVHRHPRPRSHRREPRLGDRKSTRLNSSHQIISYAVFCLKKKTNDENQAHAPPQSTGRRSAGEGRAARHTNSGCDGPCGARRAPRSSPSFFFFNDRATPEIYPLSLPAPLPF